MLNNQIVKVFHSIGCPRFKKYYAGYQGKIENINTENATYGCYNILRLEFLRKVKIPTLFLTEHSNSL